PFQRLTPIFGVQQLSGSIANCVPLLRKSDFKDGGHQTGSTYISASRLDSNAVPTANPPFSGSSNSAALLRILPDATGSRILKMAATKPEVVISQPLDKIATPFQRLTPIFWVPEFNGAIANIARCNRKSDIKNGGRETGSAYISNLDKIATCGLTAAIFYIRLPVT